MRLGSFRGFSFTPSPPYDRGMNTYLRRYLSIAALVFILGAGFAGHAWALAVDDVRIGAHPDRTRIVFDLSEKTDFRVFLLADPWRMVIDMPDFNWQVKAVPTPANSGVKGIRQGNLQPGYSRVVIDMVKPVVIKAVFFLPKDKGAPDRLVIDFLGASEADFKAQKDKVFGRLSIDGGRPQESVAISAPVTTSASAPAPHVFINKIAAPVPAPTPAARRVAPEGEGREEQLASASGMAFPARKPERKAYEKPLIVIDAGHGGIDPGASGTGGLSEKNVTLAMAKELKRQLEASGRFKVLLTRDKDTYLRLYQRVNIARKNEGDLFISLHADSIGKSSVRGASVYTLSETASDDETEMLAMRENRADLIAGVDLSAEDEVVVNILVDLTMRDTMNQSNFLANTVVGSLSNGGIRVLENGHRSAGFAVLKAPDIPSILIEMGFMSNGSDAQMLSSSSFQQKLAKALTASLDQYFERVRQNERT